MELLIFRDSYEGIRAELTERDDVRPVIMEHDGRLQWTDGTSADDAAPEAGWFSRELFLDPGAPLRDFAKMLLTTPSMKWVQSAAAGFEHPTFRKLLDGGIRLTINDASSIAIAEFVMAEVLACFQPVEQRRRAQAEHAWQRLGFREVHGSRWLILGYGSIGRHVAQRAGAFGAEVVGIRRTPQPDAHALRVVGTDALEAELAEADVLVICAAANDDNTHLVNADLLGGMKPGSVLVNIARGSIVDTSALCAALEAGRPGHAVLDVFETEPLPAEDPLWDQPGARISAHCSAFTDGAGPRGDAVFLEHLDAWRAGQPMRLEVKNPD
jgi:phosphoglycerate dehydrogenase-like enzyme